MPFDYTACNSNISVLLS